MTFALRSPRMGLHMKAKVPKENEQKFRELLLYISEKCATDPKFGATKLNKILFYSDFFAYANLGKPITGFEYQKLPNGPAPRRLLPVKKKMLRAGEIVEQEVPLLGGKIQKRMVNLRKPDLSCFSADEIALVDELIEALQVGTAEAVSELSHREVGWIAASDGETIPYSTIFLSKEPLSPDDAERGKELAVKYGVPCS